MIDITILRAMAEAGATVEMILAAVEAAQLADQTRLIEKRAKGAARKRKSRDVTRGHAMSRDVTDVTRTECDTPPAYTTPPKEIKPKKVLSAKQALPTDFELSESDKQHAFDRGWTPDKLTSELARFVDHAKAGGRKQADWHAAWRNWVTSPFQNSKANGGGCNERKTTGDVGREILAKLHAQDCAADDARRGGEGCDADDERVFDFPLLARVDGNAR